MGAAARVREAGTLGDPLLHRHSRSAHHATQVRTSLVVASTQPTFFIPKANRYLVTVCQYNFTFALHRLTLSPIFYRAVQMSKKFEKRFYDIIITAISTLDNRLVGMMTTAAQLVAWEVNDRSLRTFVITFTTIHSYYG